MAVRHKQFPHIQGVQVCRRCVGLFFLQYWPALTARAGSLWRKQYPHIQGVQVDLCCFGALHGGR